MTQPAGPDHDQRLKVLLKEFLEAFFLGFFPDWAERFEFTDVQWLDKELFLAPPRGEKRQLDLVARLRLRPGAPPPRAGVADLVALVHVELESRDSAAAFRPRMFEYYVQLRRDTQLPVLPIGLFLRVGLDGWLGRLRGALLGAPPAPLRVRLRRPARPGRRALRDGRTSPGRGPQRADARRAGAAGGAARGGLETDRPLGRE